MATRKSVKLTEVIGMGGHQNSSGPALASTLQALFLQVITWWPEHNSMLLNVQGNALRNL